MDATITYDEVTSLIGVNILSLDRRPTFERIRVVHHHFEQALQHLPCPQSTIHGWQGMEMAQELYTLLTLTTFCLPNNPDNTVVYVRTTLAGQPVDTTPLTCTEQATIDTCFACKMSMKNIERACFTALDASMNDAFKVSNNPAIQGWHTGMHVIDILDQLSTIYGQPTLAVLEMKNTVFCSPYLVADALEVLVHRIKGCAKMAFLGKNLYTDCQLITNAIRLLLTTSLYTLPFEEWDHLTPMNQTRITLCTMIQKAFQWRLNATAPTARHHGYALALH
jgi:hypothetical protein